MQKIIKRKRVTYAIVILTVFIWLLNTTTVYANDYIEYIIGTGLKAIQYDELLASYQSNSPAYNRSRITYQIEALNSTLTNETYNSMNNQYNDITIKLSELKATREALLKYRSGLSDSKLIDEVNTQLSAIDTQISQYQANANTVEYSLADTMLEEKLADFYEENSLSLLQEAQNSLKNDFLKKCYGLILTKEKQDYYETYSEYLDMVRIIEQIKNKKGISSETEVLAAETSYLKNQAAMQENRITYTKDLDSVFRETNIDSETRIYLKLPVVRKVYNPEETQQCFLSANMKLKQLQNYAKCYQDYIGYGGAKSSATYSQLYLKIQDYQLQESELRNNIKLYVKNAISAYDSSFLSYYAASSELRLKTKQLEIVTLKKTHNRATELEIRQARYEKEAAEVNYYQGLYNITIWQNILDNSVYGAMP